MYLYDMVTVFICGYIQTLSQQLSGSLALLQTVVSTHAARLADQVTTSFKGQLHAARQTVSENKTITWIVMGSSLNKLIITDTSQLIFILHSQCHPQCQLDKLNCNTKNGITE